MVKQLVIRLYLKMLNLFSLYAKGIFAEALLQNIFLQENTMYLIDICFIRPELML